MVKVREDMTGWKMWEHGVPDSRLIVIAQTEDQISKNGTRRAQYLCKCNCGNDNIFPVRASHVRYGTIKSCGCLILEETRKKNKKYNNYKLNMQDEYGKYGIGYCSNTGNEFYFDMEDYDKIKDYCWSEQKKKEYHVLHAYDANNKNVISMSNLLGFKWYDHIDRNPLNNRKCNFRLATRLENSWNMSLKKNNTSGVSGVTYSNRERKWKSRIQVNYNPICLGTFNNKDDAIKARLEAEIKYYGEFAPQKYLFEEYGVNVNDIS